MAIHSAQPRFLPTLNGNVMLTGGSLNLAKGQLGIFNIKKNTLQGVEAVSDFSTATQKDQFQLRLGNNEINVTRGLTNKNKHTRAFKISDVKDLQVHVPNQVKKFDKYLIGWDGINDDKALTFEEGVNEVLSITLKEGLIGILGYDYSSTDISVYFEKERPDQTNQEIVEKAVERVKRDVLAENVPVTDAFDISVINSENPATIPGGVSHTFYNLTVQDSGDSNDLAEVQAQFGKDAKRTDRNGDFSVYTLLLPTIAAAGVPADFTTPSGDTITWTIGEEGKATTATYTIQLADNSATGDRLTELQEAYPNLTVTVNQVAVADEAGVCQTVYAADVTSNIVFEECDPALRDLFETEPPADFAFTSWEIEQPAYSENALMGIKIEGKEVLNIPSEYIRDGVPYINTSTRVMVSGGHRSSSFMNFTEGSGDRFPVKVLERARDLENLGGDLWGAEDREFTYFQGYPRHRNQDGHQNEYIKALLGEESVLDPKAQYLAYILTVEPETFSQGFSGKLKESFDYVILVEVGKEADVETLLNALATQAGIDTVSAT